MRTLVELLDGVSGEVIQATLFDEVDEQYFLETRPAGAHWSCRR